MADDSPPRPSPSRTLADLGTTAQLLTRARQGDEKARDLLAARYLTLLRRWAHRWLPPRARSLADSQDLVQITVLRALNRIEEFEPRHEGAFLGYLRAILRSQIQDLRRRVARAPEFGQVDDDLPASEPSPLDRAIGAETLAAYESALAELGETEREAVILRVEMGYTYREIAEALNRPSANAARMMVTRALVKVAEALNGKR